MRENEVYIKRALLEQIEIVIKKLELEYENEINIGIIQLIYKRYMNALDILKNDKDINQVNINGGVRAYMESYNDYNNPLLAELHKAEKLNKKLDTFTKWLSLVKEITHREPREQANTCPRCGGRSIDFQYVGDLNTKIGYLDVWCEKCLHGIHMSRVKIPEGAEFMSFDVAQEKVKKRIPNFTQITP